MMNFSVFVEKARDIEVTYHVTKDVYELFQKCSKDLNPLHTNSDFALQKGFQSCVMYGNILNVFISHFVGMSLPSQDVMIQTQDIQYRKPVWLGDRILLKSTIEKVSNAVEIVNFKLKFYRLNSVDEELVATGHVQVGILKDK